ncbi:MAG: glycosyltransferase family 2 protein [Pygmaiobacter massiliensis]|nr:glycosyltransferase family 2 protein [Pygmaiobacter massiliensis]
MKATVVIPNLNGAGWLEGSVESIFAQTMQDFELILVDNGSTDESLTFARSLLGRPGYTLIENHSNTGFSAAVNMGIKAAKGEYVVLFNNDAFAQPDWLEQLIACAEQDENIFSVSSLMLRYYEPELADDAGDYVNILGWACKTGDGLKASRYQKQRRCFSACGGAALYRKSILDKIGLFDETFFAYLEDVDIGWRANSLGYKNIYCPAAVCRHICGATTGGKKGGKYNAFKSVQSGRNNLLLPYKNMPLLMLLVNLPFLAVGYLIKVVFFSLRGYGKPFLQGAREAFSCFGKIQKPEFRFVNLPCYIWVEFQLVLGVFQYASYRIRRAFGWT